MDPSTQQFDPIIINEAQLILAEKRTSLSAIRTGIAIIALPLSLASLLIATSRYYDALRLLNFLIPLAALNLILIVLGSYLIIRSLIRIHRHDRLMGEIKRKYSVVAELID